MSAIKRYGADLLDVQMRALLAASLPTVCERVGAYRALCSDVGELAARYHAPYRVKVALVREAAEVYAATRETARIRGRK